MPIPRVRKTRSPRRDSSLSRWAMRLYRFLSLPDLPLFTQTIGKKASWPFEPSQSVLLTQTPERARADAGRVFCDALGLRPVDNGVEWTVMEKGIPPRRLALALLAGALVLMSGLLLSALFAFEGTVTLKAGSREAFAPEGRGIFGPLLLRPGPGSGPGLLFEGSTSEYIRSAEFVFPHGLRSKLAVWTGWERPEFKEGALRPVEVRAKLSVIRDGPVARGEAGTTEPFQYGGYAFSLLSVEQTLRLKVNESPILINARPGGEAIIPGSLSTLVFGELVRGAVTRRDGSRQELRPHVAVRKKGTPGEPAVLRFGEAVIVDGALVALADAREEAVLRYRYDPGRRLLLAGGLLAVTAVSLWLCLPYYFLAYRIDASGEIVRLDVFASSGGAFASTERLIERAEALITKDDLRPEALKD